MIDVQDPARLLPEVLLYDKLVIPVPKTARETDRWREEGWHPELQEIYLQTLGNLAVRARWGNAEQLDWARQFQNLRAEADAIVTESRQNLAYEVTRMVLAQKKYPLPEGVDEIDPIAAFQSESDFRAFFMPDSAADAVHDLGMKLSQRMAVPRAGNDPQGTLTRVVQLACESEYLRKRTRVYEKQDQILATPNPTLEDVQELEERSEELVDYVRLMLSEVSYAQAFSVAAIPPGYAVGRPFPTYASRSTNLSSVFLRSNLPVLTLRSGSAPAKAMYHN